MRRTSPSTFIALTTLFAAVTVAVVATPAPANAGTRDATALWPREKPWVASLVPLLNGLSAASKQVAKQTTDPTVLVSGSNAQVKLALGLAILSSCPAELKRRMWAASRR